MKLRYLGDGLDGLGLALAGVEWVRCDDAPSVERALGLVDAEPVAVLLVSPRVAAWGGAALKALGADPEAPVVVVVPGGEDPGGAGP